MSTGPNHRRGEPRQQDNGPTWESRTPAAGSNSTHVARARKAWKRIRARAGRRAASLGGFIWGRPPAPRDEEE